MLSDMSKNLFKRAIALSGSAFNPWAFSPITDFAERLAKTLGFNGTCESELLEFLETKSSLDLIVAQNQVLTDEEKYGRVIDVPFGPVVEPSWSENPFLSKNPVIAARKAWSNNIDFIIGQNGFEGLFTAFKEYTDNIDLYLDTINNNVAYFAPLDNLKLNATSPKAKVYGQKIKDLYFEKSSNLTRENLITFYDVRLKFNNTQILYH